MTDSLYFEYGEKEINHLRKKDKKLGAVIDYIGIIKRPINPDVFSSLVESIISQQISSKAANTVCQKLHDLCKSGINNLPGSTIDDIQLSGTSGQKAEDIQGITDKLCGIDVNKLSRLSVEKIQSCGMSMRKAEYVKGVADAVLAKTIDLEAFAEMSDNDIINALTAIRGIGIWTAEMILIFSLMRPNVVSYGDLAIRKGMMRLYNLKELPKDRFQRYANRYSPYGSIASLYLWHISDPGVAISESGTYK